MSKARAAGMGASVLCLFTATTAYSVSTGPPPGTAGVPAGGGFGAELTCAAAGCHSSFDVNADNVGRVVLTGVPAEYELGRSYRLTLTVSHPEATRWGFEVTAVTADSFRGAGDFESVINDDSTQRLEGGDDGRIYIGHGQLGRPATGLGAKERYAWSFDWVAPAADVGAVTFYGIGNAANADGSPAGDHVYTVSPPPLSRPAPHR